MAFRQKGYGMTAEMDRKAMTWIEAVLEERVFSNCTPECGQVHDTLKDGVILCRLANLLSNKKIDYNQEKMPFKMMENIGNFLEFCREDLEIKSNELFQTVDLYEKRNMAQVILTINALARRACHLCRTCHQLGPKESSANKREFSEEQLRAGDGIIRLQMGSNKWASQKGDHFGRPRQVAGHDAYH